MRNRSSLTAMSRAIALFLVVMYAASSGLAEVEETDEAVDELIDDLEMRAPRRVSLVPGWALILAAGGAGAAVIVPSVWLLRRDTSSDDAEAARPPSTPPDRDPELERFEAESSRVAPQWIFRKAIDGDTRVVLVLENIGAAAAHRVSTLGLPIGSGVEPPVGAAELPLVVAPGETLSIELRGRPARRVFHLCYVDEIGFTWFRLVDYRKTVEPPVTLGLAERDFEFKRPSRPA